jgi:hypothetical protein
VLASDFGEAFAGVVNLLEPTPPVEVVRVFDARVLVLWAWWHRRACCPKYEIIKHRIVSNTVYL